MVFRMEFANAGAREVDLDTSKLEMISVDDQAIGFYKKAGSDEYIVELEKELLEKWAPDEIGIKSYGLRIWFD